MCTCACTCMCMYVCIAMCMCMYGCVRLCVSVCVSLCVSLCVYVCVSLCSFGVVLESLLFCFDVVYQRTQRWMKVQLKNDVHKDGVWSARMMLLML